MLSLTPEQYSDAPEWATDGATDSGRGEEAPFPSQIRRRGHWKSSGDTGRGGG